MKRMMNTVVAATEAAYEEVGLKREERKSVRWRLDGTIIGAELLGGEGTVAAPRGGPDLRQRAPGLPRREGEGGGAPAKAREG